jgi:chromosome partitioning protein
LAAIEIELGQKANYLIQLRQCLAPLKASDEYQVIILDCPPALGLLSMNSLSAADYLLVALQCEYLAMEGLSQILRVVNQLKESGVNDQLSVGGIIMTMFDVRTNISRQVVDEVKKHFPELLFKTLIPRSVRLSEAPSYGQSIFQYDPLSSGAKAYAKLGQEVIERFQLKKPSNA